MKKTIIVSIVSLITGALLVLFGFFVYSVIKTQQTVAYQGAALQEVVDFINKNIEAQKAGPITK